MHNVRRAAAAAGLVAELPAEDGGGGLVPRDDELDVLLERLLRRGVGVEGVVVAAVDVGVGVDAAEVVEVVEEREDELDAALLGGGNGVIEAGDAWFYKPLKKRAKKRWAVTVSGVVVEVLAAGIQNLIVDILGLGSVVGGTEAPNSEDFEAGLSGVSELLSHVVTADLQHRFDLTQYRHRR